MKQLLIAGLITLVSASPGFCTESEFDYKGIERVPPTKHIRHFCGMPTISPALSTTATPTSTIESVVRFQAALEKCRDTMNSAVNDLIDACPMPDTIEAGPFDEYFMENEDALYSIVNGLSDAGMSIAELDAGAFYMGSTNLLFPENYTTEEDWENEDWDF